MKAVRIRQYGGPEVIQLDDISDPKPKENEVLVQVKAAGVGPWDALVRTGKAGVPLSLPLTLGSEIAGIIISIGSGVNGITPGSEVFGAPNARFTDGYAEYVAAAANMLALKPRSKNFVEAASVPVVAVTAWQMLFDRAKVSSGQTVLVHGGAGNVGAYAVQLAHRAGARVIATASAEDRDFVAALGADVVIDFRRESFEDAAGNVDIVIDTVGGEVQRRSFKVLKVGGMLVSSVSMPSAEEAARHRVRVDFFIVSVNTRDLEQIANLIDTKELETSVGAVLPLAHAREAHEMLAGTIKHARGKIVLEVS